MKTSIWNDNNDDAELYVVQDCTDTGRPDLPDAAARFEACESGRHVIFETAHMHNMNKITGMKEISLPQLLFIFPPGSYILIETLITEHDCRSREGLKR